MSQRLKILDIAQDLKWLFEGRESTVDYLRFNASLCSVKVQNYPKALTKGDLSPGQTDALWTLVEGLTRSLALRGLMCDVCELTLVETKFACNSKQVNDRLDTTHKANQVE